MIVHLHNSELRNYNNDKIAHGKYFIKQIYLNEIFKNDYTYFDGVDHVGDDLLFNNSYNIEELKNYCNNNDNIVGFNTLGFIKSKIIVSNLKETNWINKNTNHGIYIKTNKITK